MKFIFNEEKNRILVATRGVSFEDIIEAIGNGNFLGIEEHKNKEKYPNQKIIYVRLADEVYSVPCIIEKDNTIFFKTLFPNRKARKFFLKL